MTARQLFSTLVGLALLLIAFVPAVDPDMWWHLRTGQAILEDGLPRQDLFSFTVPDHLWVTHEWLSQLLMWGLYRLGGFGALIVAFALITALTYWLVYRRCAGRPYVGGLLTILAAIAASGVWGPRPQLFNTLFMALFIFIVEGILGRTGRAGERAWPRRALWLLPPLTALWANLHSGYLLGVVLLGTYTVGEAVGQWLAQRRGEATTWELPRALALATAASLLASLLNANGSELWIYPFQTLGSQEMQRHIREWSSPDFHNPYNWPFALMLALGVFGWVVSPKRPTPSDFLLFMGTSAAGLVSMRHIPLMTIAAAPIIARSLTAALESGRFGALLMAASPRPRPLLNLLHWLFSALVLLAVVVQGASVIANNEREVRARYPVAALNFLERAGLADEPLFNAYSWGGYLIWREWPVFVDGRADVYGNGFLRYYFNTLTAGPGWQKPLDDFRIRYVLVERNGTLTRVLESSPEWRVVYSDKLAKIFTRAERAP